MVIDFSKVDLKERPVLLLQNADETEIQTLGYAFNLKPDICFNEISSITFDLPAFVEAEVDGEITQIKTPHYDDVVGMRTIDMDGWGRFVLVDPSIQKEGKKEIKSCKAYSLEYELTFKKITLKESTYKFWNPISPENTILGNILSLLPSWSIGEVDADLFNKARTFSVESENIYNFIKSTVQKTYSCIFDFDTYNRKINVISTESDRYTSPVYISLDNLAKSISVSEDTEGIVTVLDVNGAEGVSIRSVNPTGDNKIYNLDYYISTGHIGEDLANKWNKWKQNYEAWTLPFYNKTLDMMMKTSALNTETARLNDMQNSELGALNSQMAVEAENLASQTKDTDEYTSARERYEEIKDKVKEKEFEVQKQKELVESLQNEKDQLIKKRADICKSVKFDAVDENGNRVFFTDEDLLLLDRYFKEDSISESNFVLRNTTSYIDDDLSRLLNDVLCSFNNCTVTKINNDYDKDMYTITGGSIVVSDMQGMFAEVISACVEKKSDNSFVLSCRLGTNTTIEDFDTQRFESGCISITGTCNSITTNVVPDKELPDAYSKGTELSIDIKEARFYFTRNLTEYGQYSVEWDLYEYGEDCLNKLSYPSYSFDVSSANFLTLDEFRSFAESLSLGERIYLEIEKDKVIEPFLIGVSIDFDNLDSLDLKFGDKYSSSDNKFEFVDLLEQSISMGKSVDVNRFNYNSFIDSGASTRVKEYMDSSLDLAKNAILSSSKDMAFSIDNTGIRGRKFTADGSNFEPEQLAMINNSIVFTKDNWETVEMAIGQIKDPNTGTSWGVIAPSIVGTLIAGNNLVIESEKKDGDVSVFRVDGDGAVLHNASFDIVKDNAHIALNPSVGFGIGKYPIITKNDEGEITQHEDNLKFFVDKDGNVTMKGTLEGCDGYFDGTIYAKKIVVGNEDYNPEVDGEPNGTNGAEYVFDEETQMFKTKYLDLGNIKLDGNTGTITLGYTDSSNKFNDSIVIDGRTGNIDMTGKINMNNVIELDGNTGNINAVNISGSKITGSSLQTAMDDEGSYVIISEGSFNLKSHLHGYTIGSGDINSESAGSGQKYNIYRICTIDKFGITNTQTEEPEEGMGVSESNSSVFDVHGLNYYYETDWRCGINFKLIENSTVPEISAIKGIAISPFARNKSEEGNGGRFIFGNDERDYNSLHPEDNGTCYIGTELYKFYSSYTKNIHAENIYSDTEPVISSDERLKCDISNDYSFVPSLYEELDPVTYKFKNDSDENIRFGFIAQDVEKSLMKLGLDPDKMAILSKMSIDDDSDISKIIGDTTLYGIRYESFAPLNFYMIKYLLAKVNALEKEIKK